MRNAEYYCLTLVYVHTVHVPSLDRFFNAKAISELLKHKMTLGTLHLDVRLREHNPVRSSHAIFTELAPSLSSFLVLQHLPANTLLLYTGEGESAQEPYPLAQLLTPSIVSLKLTDNVAEPDLAVLSLLSNDLRQLAKAIPQGHFPTEEHPLRCWKTSRGWYGRRLFQRGGRVWVCQLAIYRQDREAGDADFAGCIISRG